MCRSREEPVRAVVTNLQLFSTSKSHPCCSPADQQRLIPAARDPEAREESNHRAVPQRSGLRARAHTHLCEASGLATPMKVASDRSPNCLCKKIQPGGCCKLTQSAMRKSSAPQRLAWANLSAGRTNRVANVCLDQCQDHRGPLPQCVHKAGLLHLFLNRSILTPKSPPWSLHPKAGIGSAVTFWPQTPLQGSLTPSQCRSQVVLMLEMDSMAEEGRAKPEQRQQISQEMAQ